MKNIYKKEQIIKNLGQKNKLGKKEINSISNGKDKVIDFIAGLIKRMLYKNESIFS